MDDYGMAIVPRHAKRLGESRITVEVARARQYVSADTVAMLGRHGFPNAGQAWLPALVMPWHVPDGTVAHYQVRPANPLPPQGPRGKPAKYVFPDGMSNRLGVHPLVRPHLADSSTSLWITEGLFKGDALVSAGAQAVTLTGVWGWRERNEDDESVPIADLDAVEWNERIVFIAFDADATTSPMVWKAERALWRELKSRGAQPMHVTIPIIRADGHTGVDDWLAAFPDDDPAELLDQLVDDATDSMPAKPMDAPAVLETGRPVVDVNGTRPVVEVAAEIAKRIADNDSATEVYSHGGIMSVLDVADGRAQLRPVDPGRLDWIVGHACDPVQLDRNGNVRRHVPVPSVVSRMLLTMTSGPWPVTDGLTATPFLRSDGTVVQEPGYDWLSRMVYRPLPGFALPSANGDVASAVAMLDDALADFGFEDTTSRANALALVLTPFVRPLVGLVPLFVIDSPTPGSGKGLLIALASIIATGQPCGTWPYPTDTEEARKLFTTILSTGAALAHLDEAHAVGGVHLANLLTSSEWHDRLLGHSRAVSFPNRTVWCAAGNNVEVRGDLARRVCVVRLDPLTDDPEGRPATSFRHHPLGSWAVKNRGPLVAAALTLCKAWVAAGRPAGDVTIGSFEEWSSTIGGVLAVAGIDGFMGNRMKVRAVADVERSSTEHFVRWLRLHYLDGPFTTAEVVNQVRNGVVDPPDSCGSPEHVEFAKRLGWAMRKLRGRRFGTLVVQEAAERDSHTGRPRWTVRDERPAGDWPW